MTKRREFLRTSGVVAAGAVLGTRASVADAAEAAEQPGRVPGGVATNDRVRARPVPLERVRLTGGPLKEAQDSAGGYLLALDPDRMMAFYRTRAGLTPKAQPYGGWDGAGRNLTGHIAGHHLSAVSLMYRATGDARYKQRADYLVREMKEVQDRNGDGYLSALEGGREAFAALSRGEIRSAAFDLNGLWSPWYTLHKTFAGLRDAHRYAGNGAALDVETKFARWSEGVLAPLNDAQVARMLNTEHGGMNEVLADLYADTSDVRWLALSRRFEHHAFTDALKRHQDNLPGKHGNCQIPKLIGSAARYEYTGDGDDLVAASFFWDRVAQHHSYATGGHGLAEYFGYPDRLSNRVDGRTCESCNVYNMLKLTRRLFSFRPDVVYADFHERAMFNHALASFDPVGVRMSYMVPVGRAVQQEYQNMQNDFTCCVGTGMENHALHGDGIYYESPNADTVWVNIYAPSTAELSSGTRIAMDSDFPDGGTAKLALTTPRGGRRFTLALRRPGWAGDGFAVRVNGETVAVPSEASLRVGGAGGRDLALDDPAPSSYVQLDRTWKSGDVVELALPKSVRLEPTPDDGTVAAVMWGPLILAGDLAPRREGRATSGAVVAPVLVADGPAAQWVVPSGSRSGDFHADVGRSIAQPGAASTTEVAFTPFYRTHGRTYSVYFDVLTPAEFDARVAAHRADLEHQQALEAATLAHVQPGDTAAEEKYNYRSEPADRQATRTGRSTARGGPGWFSYDLPVEAAADASLIVTYFNDLGLPVLSSFDLVVDGTTIGHYTPNRQAGAFWDQVYGVPASLLAGKTRITVKFAAAPDSRIAPVYGVRLVRGNP
ncbi:MAG TPA: beta-L-arabinofuranosidase domain-containing protein [Gemmatimonadaceae bacterium]|nr:beta-L-arabinofuranosidase domain-containing protein [Gemmatimonadaceae bacterium]